MKASEWVSHIQELIEEHGDLEVVGPDDDPVTPPEHNHDPGLPAAFVIDMPTWG